MNRIGSVMTVKGKTMADKKFPQDCNRKCPHYHTWDMSVDDWTNVCDLLKAQIDDCDMDFQWMYCPLKEGEV